jgi:hypothetical protein
VVLSGEKKQTVNFSLPSYQDNKSGKVKSRNHFNILQIKNRYIEFVTTETLPSYRSFYWQNKLIPFVLNVQLNETAVKFQKYSPLVIKGVFYIEVEEVNKLLDSNLVYDAKKKTAAGKYGSTKLSVKGTTSKKQNYIQIEALLKQMKLDFAYDPKTQTLSIKK